MDKKELEFILQEGENEKVEFKPSLSQMDEIVQACAGFANLRGGIILIGVSDGGEVLGCDIGAGSIENLANIINQRTEPKVHPEVSVEKIDGKKIIVVNISESIDKPVLASGKLYKRIGKSTSLSSRNEFEKLVLEKHKEKVLFDSQICNEASLKDIDKETVSNFIKLAKDSGRISVEGESLELILKKLGLLNESKISNAGILLFGKFPKKFFNNTIVKCGRFKDETTEEFIDIKDFNGNLFYCLEKSISFLKEHLRFSAKIEGLLRKEKLEIPLEALREAIINSLIHRDYFSSGFIYIKIYDNKVIIANPGKLPEGISLIDLYGKHESIPKNPLLADVFYYTGLIDVWGRGISNIIRNLKENGLKKPKFEESAGYFRIIFSRPQAEELKKGLVEGLVDGLVDGLAESQKRILELVEENPHISKAKLAEKIGISMTAIDKNLERLKQKNLLKRVGPDKGGYWKILK